MMTWRAAISSHCALVPCVESASKQLAPGVWVVAGCDEVGMVREDIELLVDRRRAKTHTVKLFVLQILLAV